MRQFLRMRVVGKARFVRKRVALQPGQQPGSRRADHVGLRKVDVQVDEARRDDAAGQVLDRHARIVGREAVVVAHRAHDLPALRVGTDQQQAVLFINGRAVVGKSQDRSAEGFHSRYFATLPWTPETRKFIDSICSSVIDLPARSTCLPSLSTIGPVNGRSLPVAMSPWRSSTSSRTALRHLGAEVSGAHHRLLHPAPEAAALPAAVEHGLDAAHVVVAPVVSDGNDLRVGRGLAHVGVIGDRHLAALLRRRHHGGGRRMERDHVHVLVEQRHGRIAFARRDRTTR